MTETSSHDKVAELLQAADRGDRAALDDVFALVYRELTELARHQRRRWHGDLTLNTTALVHEAYLKVVEQKRLPAESRAHLFAVAARAMRHILCNYARDRGRRKRGGGATHVTLESDSNLAAQLELSEAQTDTLNSLDESLRALEQIAERPARVVECRFFGGMSVDDTAAALDISPRTVKRDWNFARAWLKREMTVKLDLPD
jgi:RNA polymerase sigma factor (TIGR02999 family)